MTDTNALAAKILAHVTDTYHPSLSDTQRCAALCARLGVSGEALADAALTAGDRRQIDLAAGAVEEARDALTALAERQYAAVVARMIEGLGEGEALAYGAGPEDGPLDPETCEPAPLTDADYLVARVGGELDWGRGGDGYWHTGPESVAAELVDYDLAACTLGQILGDYPQLGEPEVFIYVTSDLARDNDS